ncbi:MAG: IS1634 family transposase [bacterium]|nr:IS1634 family transposase [bacterium]
MKLRVAFAKRRYKDRTYSTPLVVTSYRDSHGTPRNKTLASLAKLPAFLVDLIDRALRLGDTDVLAQYLHIGELKHVRSLVVGPVYLVFSLLKQLGIFDLLRAHLSPKQAAAIQAIVVERVTAAKPLSVMALQRRFAGEPLAHLLELEKSPALKTWYAALARLEEHRESILQALYRRNHTPGRLYLYDITSSYFEGDACVLAAFGYNRDGKKGKKQIVVGIICEERGCPIWVDVFKGNTSDQTTVKQQLLNLRDKLGIKEFTFVGDRGMVTHARIEELEQEGWWESFRYITALTRNEMMALVEDEKHPLQLELFDHENLVEVEQQGTRYVLCHNPQRVERDSETRQRLLAATEAKLESIRNNVAAGRWKKEKVIARRLHRWINRWGMERFFEVQYEEGSFSFSRRDAEIERYARLDGCYVIRSNVAEGEQTTEQLRDRYKDLKYVEQAFRTMKTTDIQTRPIRHFHEAQVRGHVFACFLAYRVVWEIRQRLEPVLRRDPATKQCEAGSLAEVWRDLATVTLAKLTANGKTFLKLSEISPYVQKLLTLCQVPSLEDFRISSE